MRERLKTLLRRPEPCLYYLMAALLLACAGLAVHAIPPATTDWGVDTQNLHAFHHCAIRNTPYAATSPPCDPWGRPLNYPPSLYWAYGWMRWVSFPVARALWTAVTVVILLWFSSMWTGGATRGRRWLVNLFGALLAVQFPAVFAIERGNTDVVVLLGWSVALALVGRGWPLVAGAVLGALVLFKVYPAIGCAVVGAFVLGAVVLGPPPERRVALRLGAGMALGGLALGLLFFKQNLHYFRVVLPTFATAVPAPAWFAHSVPSTFGPPAPARTAKLLSAGIIAVWSLVAFFRLRRAPRDVLAGALAISTFVGSTSYDYNLVTVYPLLVVLLRRGLEPRRGPAWWAWLALLGGIVTMTAQWSWFPAKYPLRVELQIAWLVVVALLLAVSPPRAPAGAQAQPAPA